MAQIECLYAVAVAATNDEPDAELHAHVFTFWGRTPQHAINAARDAVEAHYAANEMEWYFVFAVSKALDKRAIYLSPPA